MIPLSKYHSYGNDFLVLLSNHVPGERFSEFARAACEPHFGLGADGCVFLNLAEGRTSLRIFNRDGSEAGMSGNGVRCAAAFLHHRGLILDSELEIETTSGTKSYHLMGEGKRTWTYQSNLGRPGFRPAEIPFRAGSGLKEVRDFPILVKGETVRVHALSVGNPQCALLLDRLPFEEDFRRLGSLLERHRRFPERTNVSFVRVLKRSHLKIRIWERGVGPTHSSGTGSCGAAVAAIRHGLVDSPVTVETATGKQTVEWEAGQEIRLTGTTEFIADIQFFWRN